MKSQTDYKKLIHDQVGGVLNMVYGLLGLAIVVAILGVVNTLALSVVERTREIGLIRAIGMGRRKTRRMIRLESVVIALFGAALGVGLGLAWGVAAQRVLVRHRYQHPGDPGRHHRGGVPRSRGGRPAGRPGARLSGPRG